MSEQHPNAKHTIELRTFTYIDKLESQLACFIATVSQGFFPLEGEACLFVEIKPGISINEVTDIVLKKSKVVPGLQIVERAYGVLEIHSRDPKEIKKAGDAILSFYGMKESDRITPTLLTNEIIRDIEGYQAMIVNRNRHGQMLLTGKTLLIVECHPAGYAAILCNHAERAAKIRILEMLSFGAFGRINLGGEYEEIVKASQAIEQVVASIKGKGEEEEKYL
jgi:hypothetical protein